MADAKITALTELTSADGADLLPIVDDVAGTPTTKKITLTNIAAWLASLAQTLTNKTLTSPKINEDVALTATATQLNALVTGGSNYSSIFRQALINPNCQVLQPVTAVNLTTGKLHGPVDMFYAKGAGTAVSAGTITQTTSANVGNSGFALKLAGVTITGTGKVHAYTFIESLNAKLYKNKTASFSVKVYHDVGSAINYVIKINKANSADNFSAVTNIATDSAESVNSATETLIKLENVSLGDCSNGIEIEIEASCGAITTKNFEFGDWQFNEGANVYAFACKTFEEELVACQRHYEKSYEYAVAPGTAVASNSGDLVQQGHSSAMGAVTFPFKVKKRVAPTLTFYDQAGTSAKISYYTSDYFDNGAVTLSGSGINYGFVLQLIASSTQTVFSWRADARPTIA